jgi:hypothetical protein
MIRGAIIVTKTLLVPAYRFFAVDEKNAPQPKIASLSGERRNDELVGGLV